MAIVNRFTGKIRKDSIPSEEPNSWILTASFSEANRLSRLIQSKHGKPCPNHTAHNIPCPKCRKEWEK